jgi:hypothetical protein
LVVGVEGTGETCGGGARVRVGELESLHSERTSERASECQRAFMIVMEKILLYYFSTALPLKRISLLRVETGAKPSPPPTVPA